MFSGIKKIYTLIYIILVSGCQSLPTQDFIAKFAEKSGATHIASQCYLLDFTGETVLQHNGDMCIFEDDGSTVIARGQTEVAKFDKNFKLLWRQEIRPHHQLDKSIVVPNQYLTLGSTFVKRAGNKKVRVDELFVLSEEGEILKTYSFTQYPNLYSHKQYLSNYNINRDNKNEESDLEATHVNSFAELYKIENGKKTLSGYVAHCHALRKIIIFDIDLKKIVKEFDLTRSIHAVQPLDEENLIFYVNRRDKSEQNLSYIETLHIENETYTPYYENKSTDLMSVACSSVQIISKNDLFILHSGCAKQQHERGSYVEFVDLQKDRSEVIHLKKTLKLAHAKLINAAGYLKNNIGR